MTLGEKPRDEPLMRVYAGERLRDLPEIRKGLQKFTNLNCLPGKLQITGGCLVWLLPIREGEFVTLQIPGDKENPFLFNPQSMTVRRAQELGRLLTSGNSYCGRLRTIITGPAEVKVFADLFWPTRLVLWEAAIGANGEVTYQVIDKSTLPEPNLPRLQSTIILPKLTAPSIA